MLPYTMHQNLNYSKSFLGISVKLAEEALLSSADVSCEFRRGAVSHGKVSQGYLHSLVGAVV